MRYVRPVFQAYGLLLFRLPKVSFNFFSFSESRCNFLGTIVISKLDPRLSGPEQIEICTPGLSSQNPVYSLPRYGPVLHTANLNKTDMQLLGLDDKTARSLVHSIYQRASSLEPTGGRCLYSVSPNPPARCMHRIATVAPQPFLNGNFHPILYPG